jgi:rubrerythrin
MEGKMSYRISDLIEKLISIEEDSEALYSKLESVNKTSSPAISLVSKVLAKEEEKHVLYYKALLKDVQEKNNAEIDFFLYDKAVKQLYEFRKRIQAPELNNVRDLVKFAVEFERSNIGLILDIQGKLVEKLEDVSNEVYEVLAKIIKEEQKHEEELKRLLENKK